LISSWWEFYHFCGEDYFLKRFYISFFFFFLLYLFSSPDGEDGYRPLDDLSRLSPRAFFSDRGIM